MLQMQHLKEEKLGEQTTKYCKGTGGADSTVPVSFALEEKRETAKHHRELPSMLFNKCFGRWWQLKRNLN